MDARLRSGGEGQRGMSSARQLRLMPPPAPVSIRPAGNVAASSGGMVLRDYQKRAVQSIARFWADGKDKVLLVAPTGSGKTAMACALVAELERRGRPVLFCVHRDVLISQTTEAMEKWGIRCGHIKAGWRENRDALVQVCSVQSLARRDWWASQEFDFTAARPTIVLDECHTTAWAEVVRDLLSAYPQMRVVGLTATPWRLSKREAMGDVFDAVALSPFPAELIAAGYLVPPVYYGVKAPPDLSQVRTRGGEYVEEDLERACDTPEMVRALADDYLRVGGGTRALAFTVTVAHAHHVAEEFKRRGVPAAAVDGSTPIEERSRLYAALRRGELRLLSSCAVLSEGFDVPEVACCLLARPTKSRALFHQQLGRGLRIAPWDGKGACTVIDQAGNVGRFGMVEDFAEFELRTGKATFEAKKNSPDDEEEPQVKQCPHCELIVKRLVPRCPSCGYLWPLPKVGFGQHTTALVRRDLPVEDRALAYRDLLRRAYVREWKPEAAAVQYRDAFGSWPDRTWVQGAVMGMHPTADDVAEYRIYLEAVATMKDMDEPAPWIDKWVAAELGDVAAAEGGAQ